jgi:hypothetical protein
MSQDSELRASTVPFKGNKAEIEIYIVTGFHGLVKIPESYCKECHMFVRAAQEASEQVDQEVDIQVKSYWTRFLRPLLKGGTHPPVMLVNGGLVAQGYDVPGSEEIAKKLSMN